MYQLIYISDKTETFSNQDVDQLLSKSRVNNHKKNVTGLLLDLSKHFIQILEGEQDQVEAIYSHICSDPRHHNIRLVLVETILKSEFGGWSMGFTDDLEEIQVQDAIHILNAFAQKKHFNAIQASSLRMLLKSLVY
jgi:hypothetical protein